MSRGVFARTVFLCIGAWLGLASASSGDGILAYQGSLGTIFGSPAVGAFVVPGTFAAGFDPFLYKYAYGIDPEGNMLKTCYSQAVSDGNFRPIGDGTLSVAGGRFSGLGAMSSASENGNQIYLFCFDGPDPDQAWNFALCTGAGGDWVTSTSSGRAILASSANTFVFGQKGHDYDIVFQGLPIPEPSFVVMLLAGAAVASMRPVGRLLRERPRPK